MTQEIRFLCMRLGRSLFLVASRCAPPVRPFVKATVAYRGEGFVGLASENRLGTRDSSHLTATTAAKTEPPEKRGPRAGTSPCKHPRDKHGTSAIKVMEVRWRTRKYHRVLYKSPGS